MEIKFQTKKLRKKLENIKTLIKEYGKENALKIVQRIKELHLAPSLSNLPLRAKAHPLKNNRSGQFTVTIKQPYRIIFKANNKFDILDYSSIKSITILEIVDYH